jgi:hypothetical protein
MRKIYVYIIGVMFLGAAHDWLKAALPNGWIFLLVGTTYLFLARWAAERFGKP